MSNKFYLPSLLAGFGAAVIAIIPGIKVCIVIPLAVFIAQLLFRKALNNDQNLTMSKGLLIGFLTGVFAAFFATLFDVLVTLFTHTNDFVESLPQMLRIFDKLNLGEAVKPTIDLMNTMANQITTSGFSLLYTMSFLFGNLMVDSVFGLLGGILGRLIVNRRSNI